MNDSALFRLTAVAALYAAYLLADFLFGERLFGTATFYWHEGAVLATAAVLLVAAGRRSRWPPMRRFLLLLAASLALLLVTTVSYEQGLRLGAVDLSDGSYLLFLAGWIGAWGYLTLHLARINRPSRPTILIFLTLMAGFALLFAGFYAPVYSGALDELSGRVDAAMAVLELGSVITGLAALLLGIPTALVLAVFGMALLAGADMLYTDVELHPEGFTGVDPVWSLGLFLLLACALVLPREESETSADGATGSFARAGRSGLSTVMLALSLGAVLLSAVVMVGLEYAFGHSPDPASAGQPFFVVLFVVLLVVVMVWLTDHFDRAVRFVERYGTGLLSGRLAAGEWRGLRLGLDWILEATGLGRALDSLGAAAARLRQDILFLGPERLNPPAAEPADDEEPGCFIMMPFSLEDSDEVHHILRRVCREAGVRPVRGDDLFTPTDILDDIWRGITAARFIIADITGRNPNVMYELGMAHTLAKPVLILSRNADDIPIDLATRRVILYGTSGDWQSELAEKAASAIQAMLRAYPARPEPGERPAAETAPGG